MSDIETIDGTRTVYKLTASDRTTCGGTRWLLGVWRESPGEGDLCTDGWLHCYSHPLLAALLDPVNGNFGNYAKLWEAEAGGRSLDDHGRKLGVERLRIVREMDLPVVPAEARVRWAILCAMEVYTDEAWMRWADAWLSGEDRSGADAAAAAAAADAAASDAAAAAADAAAAAAAADAARAAASDAAAADAAAAARAAAAAADAAAAHAAAWAVSHIDLVALAERAIREEAGDGE